MSDNLGNVMNGVMWVQVVLAMLFVGARIYTRYVIMHSLGWDDILMLLNLIAFIGFVACISVGTTYGVGKKASLIPGADYPKAVMWEVIGQGICILGIAASKSSVALFLLRIVNLQIHKRLLWMCIVTTCLLCIVTTILLFVQCEPAAYLWDTSIKGGYCKLDFTPIGITTGAWSAVMDFVLALFPWTVVWNLNMKRKEKLTVLSGLSLGVFAGICSIIRTYELQTLSSQAEYVYNTVPMLLWSTTEILVTIVCACIPVLRPLYVKIKRGIVRTASNSDEHRPSIPLHSWNAKGNGTGKSAEGARYMGQETGCEEGILMEQRDLPQTEGFYVEGVYVPPGRILKTVEITVASE